MEYEKAHKITRMYEKRAVNDNSIFSCSILMKRNLEVYEKEEKNKKRNKEEYEK